MSDRRPAAPDDYAPSWIESAGPYLEFWLAATAAVVMYLSIGTLWHAAPWEREIPLCADPALAVLGLALIATTYVLRGLRTGQVLRFRWLDVALYAFVASSALGVWAAWDRQAALAILLFLIAGVALFHAVRAQPGRAHLLMVLVLWGIFGLCFSLAFLATTDWQSYAAKIPYGNRLTDYLRRLIPARAEPFVNSNDAGGILALVLPAYVPLIAYRRYLLARGRRAWTIFWVLAALLVVVGWVLTLSRGAWAGLLAASALWGLWRLAGFSALENGADRAGVWRHQMRIIGAWFIVGLLTLALVGILVLIGYLPGAGALNGRLNLWDGGLLLAHDYPIFGAGLGAFPMHYSLYTLLIDVGFIFSSHNLLIDLLVEQGVIGLIAALFFGLGVLSQGLGSLGRAQDLASHGRIVVEACLVALFAVVVHGAVQNVYYGSPAGMLLAVPLGLVAHPWRLRVARPAAPDSAQALSDPAANRSASALGDVPRPARIPTGVRWGLAAAALLVALGVGVWQRQRLAGVWWANLGAVAQARVELSNYNPNWAEASLDTVRRSSLLDAPQDQLRRALQADPANRTARLRLASIALARGDYSDALEHAQAVWDTGYRDRVTRLVLGDALVAAGRPTEAAECVRGLQFAVERLQGQGWERYYANADFRRAADAWYTVMLLDPDDPNVPYWHAEALALLDQQD